MGNWRAVQIVGTCGPDDVDALKSYLAVDFTNDRWGPLHNGGAAGLPNWAAEKISACGNLGERDYDPDYVRDELLKLAGVAPSLSVKVHCGGDYEDTKCVATVNLHRGRAVVIPPEIEQVEQPSQKQIQEQILHQLNRNTQT